MQPGNNYLVISGPQTALRFATPAMANLRLGNGLQNDCIVSDADVAEEHLELFIGPELGVRALAADTAIISADGEFERPLAQGDNYDLRPGERVRAGSIEVALVVAKQQRPQLRTWNRAVLIEKAQAALEQGQAVVLLRLGGPAAQLAEQLLARVSPGDIVAQLSREEVAVALLGAQEADAQKVLRGLEPTSVSLSRVTEGTIQAALSKTSAAPAATNYNPQNYFKFSAPAYLELEQLLQQLSQTNLPVLVTGETGTGKDILVARLHYLSGPGGRPLHRVSCLDLADAIDAKLLEKAVSGTLQLDEIAALSQRDQLALSHLLEQQAAQGSTTRVVATSNQDLSAMVAAGKFRKDLYFRLNRFALQLPPLRELKSDIAALSQHFLRSAGAHPELSLAAQDALSRYSWPGNLRELKSALERAALSAQNEAIELAHLPPELSQIDGLPAAPAAVDIEATQAPGEAGLEAPALSLREEMAALERRRILEALDKYPTQTEAAKALGIPTHQDHTFFFFFFFFLLRTFLNRLDALKIPRARKK